MSDYAAPLYDSANNGHLYLSECGFTKVEVVAMTILPTIWKQFPEGDPEWRVEAAKEAVKMAKLLLAFAKAGE